MSQRHRQRPRHIMKNPLKKIVAPLAFAVLGFLGTSAQAQILTFTAGTSVLPIGGPATANIEARSLGFTMGATSYSLTSLVLPLAFDSGTSPSGISVTLYGFSSAAGPASGTPVTTTLFTNPTFTYNNANSSSPTYTSYTFTPSTALTLTAGMSYWLVVGDNDNPSGSVAPLYWEGGSGTLTNSIATQIIATGKTAAAPGGYYSQSGTALSGLTSATGNTGDFTINGTAVVPEPSTWALGMVGLGLLALRLRSRRQAEAFSR